MRPPLSSAGLSLPLAAASLDTLDGAEMSREGEQMAYDQGLAERVLDVLGDQPALTERRMFGGISFMLRGNYCCGVIDGDLVVRVGRDVHEAALSELHAREMDFTGRPMRGWVFVAGAGVDADEALRDWVGRGVEFALSLPPK